MRKRACEQRMRQLPSYRTDASNPVFAKTALDLFGPFEVKVERKTIKEAWCCIFTCMTSRAVHLELCTDKSTDTFFQKIRMPKRTPEIGLVRPWDQFCRFPKIPAGDGAGMESSLILQNLALRSNGVGTYPKLVT